jgi:hypothetical protein
MMIVSTAGFKEPIPEIVFTAPLFDPMIVYTGDAVEMSPSSDPVGRPNPFEYPGGGVVLY